MVIAATLAPVNLPLRYWIGTILAQSSCKRSVLAFDRLLHPYLDSRQSSECRDVEYLRGGGHNLWQKKSKHRKTNE